ncbi:four helix bundle protein [Candidatus Uhrbacteria bacterium]|nr:four helix bundle protein [Candidatus Uhrbacteria bacterium]
MDDLRMRCKVLSIRTIKFVECMPNKRAAWIITDQLLRSIMSIGANLSEARGSGSRLEFKRFHEIALKSANESMYWLEVLRDSDLVEPNGVVGLLDEVEQVSRMIAAGVKKLKAGLSGS